MSVCEGMAWGDRPGRIDMGSYTLKSRSSPAPDCRFTKYGICDPTHSPFLLWSRHTTHRSRSIYPSNPLRNSISFLLLFHILFSILARLLPFSSVPVRPALRFPTLFSRYLFPNHILAPFLLTNPTGMRRFPPRCFNHLYLFQFSALFFSQPFRSDRRGFSS